MAEKKTYWQLLRDPRWQRLRLEIMEAANFACSRCEKSDDTLNVHHRLYRKGAKPWEYAPSDLECLCEDCHENEHKWRALLNEAVAKLSSGRIEELVGMAEGLVAIDEVDEALGNDEEAPFPSTTHRMRSYEHTWGFYLRIRGSVAPKEIDALIDRLDISASDVFQIAMRKINPSELFGTNNKDDDAGA